MKNISLSYILTTKNKLPYLKESLPSLIQNCQRNEEIIVIDGNSTDGTKDYLIKLYKKKKIDFVLSEKDVGEGHGINKGFLLAKGELIKIISDDDVFSYSDINKCKRFMQKHVDIDALGTEGLDTDWSKSNPCIPTNYENDFRIWKKNTKPFSFCGLGLMIRKKALPLLGLFHTGMLRIDLEYGYKITSIGSKLAWYTGCSFIRITNELSNSKKFIHKFLMEGKKYEDLYLHWEDPTIKRIKDLLNEIKIMFKLEKNTLLTNATFMLRKGSYKGNIHDGFILSNNLLKNYNKNHKGRFLY